MGSSSFSSCRKEMELATNTLALAPYQDGDADGGCGVVWRHPVVCC